MQMAAGGVRGFSAAFKSQILIFLQTIWLVVVYFYFEVGACCIF
jgi:hypothetical protein